MIKPPFANYPRAELERLVLEGWERIEQMAYYDLGTRNWGHNPPPRLNALDFQVLCAADAYLRSTKAEQEE